jgi:hypothetical protein
VVNLRMTDNTMAKRKKFVDTPLYCLSFLDLPLLITSLVSTNFFRMATVLSVILRITTSNYLLGIYKLFSYGHCIVCHNTVAIRKKFVDTKEVIRSGKSKNDRQYSGQTKKVCRYQGGN